MERALFQRSLIVACLMLLVSSGGSLVAQTHQVIINELMQSNIDALFYRKDFPDSWFEVYNTTGKKINMKGWSIGTSSDYAKAYKLYHTRELPAAGHILLYCDKKDDGWEHTDFRLESTKAGALYLWNADGVLIDSVAYEEMPAPNIAWGRVTDGADEWQFEVTPTPGEPNESRGSDFLLPNPIFSHAGRLLTVGESFLLSIAFPDAALPSDTRLYVTLDGSAPTKASASYAKDEPCRIQITKTTVVRARLISDFALTSLPVTHSYIFHPRELKMPVFSLVTDSDYLYDEKIGILSGAEDDPNANYMQSWRRPLNVEYFVADSTALNQLCETSVGGKTSRVYKQKSLRLYAHKRFGTKHFIFPFWFEKPEVEKNSSLMLRNGGSRSFGSRTNDAFVQQLLYLY